VFIFILIILGLIFGSFVNALVWRVYKQSEFDIISQKKPNNKKIQKLDISKYSILKGRSMCPYCKHELSATDLIPVLSWLLLRGKCRYCKKQISIQYPLVELFTALLFVISFLAWPTTLNNSWEYLNFVTWLIMIIGLIGLAIYDIKWMILPDKIIYPILIIAILSFVTQLILGRATIDLIMVILSSLIGGGLFWLIYQISNGNWIGGGDVKLGFLLGILVVRPELAFLVLFLASILGIVYIMPLLISKKLKKTSKVPFGPFLIMATFIVILYGPSIVNWYKSLILIS